MNSLNKSRIFVVEDDITVQQSLVWSLREIDATIHLYSKPSQILDLDPPDTSSCILVDLRLPEMDGLELLKTLRSKGWAMPFVVITGYGDVSGAVAAMKLGATHYLEKPLNESELTRVVSFALEQDEKQNEKRRYQAKFRSKLSTLTPRETQVLHSVVAGMLNKEIANDLGLSIKTVETHRSNLTRKLDVDSVAQLVRLMVETASVTESGEANQSGVPQGVEQ